MEDINYVDHVDPEPSEDWECCGDPGDCDQCSNNPYRTVSD